MSRQRRHTLDRETIPAMGTVLGPVAANDVAVDRSHFGKKPKQAARDSQPHTQAHTAQHPWHGMADQAKQLRPNLNSVSSRSRTSLLRPPITSLSAALWDGRIGRIGRIGCMKTDSACALFLSVFLSSSFQHIQFYPSLSGLSSRTRNY